MTRNKYSFPGQINFFDYIASVQVTCRECEYSKLDIYAPLHMCRHPDVMKVHGRWRGKFDGRYTEKGYPDWCPIMDPDRWKPYREG